MVDNEGVHLNTVNYFSMSGNCMYVFNPAQYVNTFPASKTKGFIAANKDFDEFFVGTGKTRTSAMVDWKTKFHGYFQRFETFGAETEKDKRFYQRIKDSIDMKVYESNRTILKPVQGVISNCRSGNWFPCSYKLAGSSDIYQVPEYAYVDSSFLLLEKGMPFRALFEYSPECLKVQRILFGEQLEKS